MANKPKRLLIVTQVVDKGHPILGFFHRWIEEFARHCELVTVICLQEGQHTLPGNVRVLSLGKEQGVSKGTYVVRFFRYIWKLRHEYDVVFVHMNPEYLVAAGWLWRLLRKRVALWYTHGTVNAKLRIAAFFAHRVFTASRESFRLPSKKVCVTGHGIDTDLFTPDPNVRRGSHFLSVGRLMPSKRHDLVIRAAYAAGVPLRIVGDGPERERLETFAKKLGATVVFAGALPQEALVHEYQTARAFVHTSETGSLDKVVLEALACGCPVITTSAAYEGFPVRYAAALPEAIAKAAALHEETDRASAIIEKHSLAALIPRILQELTV